VLDTVRADAVSAYGTAPAGTTPTLDGIARSGTLYTQAYAPAPWTLPSHVSLFTGLTIEKHGVGVSQRVTADSRLQMIAERFADAGYATAAFIENGMVGAEFNVHQGFSHVTVQSMTEFMADLMNPGSSGFSLERSLTAWLEEWDGQKPFFIFVNVLDAHIPYGPREHPDRAILDALDHSLCSALPADTLSSIRDAYLGDVTAADTKLGVLMQAVQHAAGDRTLITVVTSDHGEMLGEDRLFDHQFTLHNAALHVPLVVAGVPGQRPGVVDTPVTLMDVTASLLAWAELPGADEIDGRPLPMADGDASPPRDILFAYADRHPDDWPDGFMPFPDQASKRSRCGATDRVVGDMASLIRYPYKMVWYEKYPAALYDLSSDAGEAADLSPTRADVFDSMQADLLARMNGSALFAATGGTPLDAAAEEKMRALGYVE